MECKIAIQRQPVEPLKLKGKLTNRRVRNGTLDCKKRPRLDPFRTNYQPQPLFLLIQSNYSGEIRSCRTLLRICNRPMPPTLDERQLQGSNYPHLDPWKKALSPEAYLHQEDPPSSFPQTREDLPSSLQNLQRLLL